MLEAAAIGIPHAFVVLKPGAHATAERAKRAVPLAGATALGA